MAGAALTLALETATGRCSVALTRGCLAGGDVLAEWTLNPGRMQQRSLLGAAAALLRQSGSRWRDISLLAVSLGPGSFTGVRIGLAAAKGLAMALDTPLLGVSTLEALACAGADQGDVCCLLDARRDQLYGACYRLSPGERPRELLAPLACAPAVLAEWLRQRMPREALLLIGDGVGIMGASLEGIPGLAWVGAHHAHPRAAVVGLLAGTLQESASPVSAALLAPIYLRSSEAEENRR